MYVDTRINIIIIIIIIIIVTERGKPKGNVEFSWFLHSRILTRVKRHLRCDRLKRSECGYVS